MITLIRDVRDLSVPFVACGPSLSRRRAAAVALLAVGALTGGLLVYRLADPRVPMFAVQLAGIDPGRITAAVNADWALVAGYLVALVAAGWLGVRVAWTPAARTAAALAIAAGVAAGTADAIENILLYLALHRSGDGLWRAAQTAAYLKFGLLAYALPATAVAWSFAVGRLLSRRTADPVPAADRIEGVPPLPPPGGGTLPDDPPPGDRQAPAAHWAAGRRLPPGRGPAGVGICVSGGGIRSACVALGALQSLRAAGELGRARYLVSVSGGGYLTGALQLAMQPRPRADDPDRTVDDPNAARPADVLAPGSVEEDHLRRHSRYVADTAREWAEALGVLLRGLLMSLALGLLTVTVLGITLAGIYRRVPVSSTMDGLRPQFSSRGSLPFPSLHSGVLIAAGLVAAAALLAYLLAAMLPALTRPTVVGGRIAGWITLTGAALAGLAALVSLLGMGIPALVWLAAKVLGGLADRGGPASTPAGSAVSTVLLAYLGAVVGMVWRGRARISGGIGLLRRLRPGAGEASRAVPHGIIQQLLLWLVSAVLLAALLLVLGVVVGNAAYWPRWLPIVAWVAFALAVLCLDQTWLSLHPFYRRRLASAFSVRRATNAAGQVVAAPYGFDRERTTLSRYGARVDGFPQVIFAAAANLSGSDRTPPGRRAVSFTLSHDWIGGPDVGWMPTSYVERTAHGQLRRDLTVQAAVAISGAAFASAMGRQARAYQTFFALSNARLGAWLPNPAFLHLRQKTAGDWRLPQLPRLRRLNYLLREIFGAFPPQDRLLFCTDGGHYENLGLVELLRHGCRLVYCIDASGDDPPFATTLAEAITLAQEELGVRIALDAPRDLIAGSATALDPADPLAVLNARLCRTGVVVGRITYPEPVPFPDGPASRYGAFVLAKATLPAELPYELLSYAVSNPVFPRDSTSDQWFDHGQFDAYQALGSYLGRCAAQIGPDAEARLDQPNPTPNGSASTAGARPLADATVT